MNKKNIKHGGAREGSGRKSKGLEHGLSGDTIKFSVNMPIELEQWIMSKDGKNRNDKLITYLISNMKKG